MLEKIDLDRIIKKEDSKEEYERLKVKLALLQRQCKEAGIPIMIVFEGMASAGKGTQINKLITPMDPRGFQVFATEKVTSEELRYPFLWRFWTKTPPSGRIAIYDSSWYCKVSSERLVSKMSKGDLECNFKDILSFEKQLCTDGMVIIKFFLLISKKEQKKRFDVMLSKKELMWRVSDFDMLQHKNYNKYIGYVEEMLERTETSIAPWTIVEGNDGYHASMKILSTVVSRLESELENVANKKPAIKDSDTSIEDGAYRTKVLAGIDLNRTYTRAEYKKKLKELQAKMSILHDRLYLEKIPLIICFEGWDAGGKGGAIKRLAMALDPRGYAVFPNSAPNDEERQHHYLWRFWRNMPKTGHIAIFDRTWYGRVMVERIEGFCSKEEWKRAFSEINAMEAHLAHFGGIVLKFWLHIDKDEQEKRFNERLEIPEKQWKITEEDWRNRDKWDEYEVAVDDMLIKTSTSYAPWIVVEGNSKYYARIKVLEEVINAVEARLNN